jgi:hypothetical protein
MRVDQPACVCGDEFGRFALLSVASATDADGLVVAVVERLCHLANSTAFGDPEGSWSAPADRLVEVRGTGLVWVDIAAVARGVRAADP